MRFRELFGLRSKPSKALIAWMRDPGDKKKATPLSLDTIRRERPNEHSPESWNLAAVEKFFATIEKSLREGEQFITASLDSGLDGAEHVIVGTGESLDRYIQSLALNVPSKLTLSDLSIKTLYLAASHHSVRLTNCNVRDLHVHGSASELRLSRSNVGTLHVGPGMVAHYEMQGGSLLNVSCPPPGPGNPFTGTVSFTKDVFFPRERDKYVLQGPQAYRNMRYHLRSLENAQMANLIHSAELAVEREDDTWTNRVISYLYEWMSDFGSSALRPFLWLVFLYLSSAFAIWFSDGAISAVPASELVGWQRVLIDPVWGPYARALYLALQPVVNPIGLLGPKSLLIPDYTLLAVWLSVHGFLGLILLALLIFAIRRRFKIQA